jgi:UDP-N-acetylmuramate-alanine ligase
VPGRHNALNAAGALAAGIGLGLPPALLREGLARYAGVRRRFEFRGEVRGVRVFDDYSHNPSKVRAALLAARQVAGTGASSSSSSRTATAGRSRSPTSSARRSGWPTRSW